MNTKKPARSDARKFLEGIAGPLTLGSLLESIRKGEEWSQVEMAERLGVSKQYLNDIEKGRRDVSVERAVEYAQILGYSPEQFVRLALQAQVDRSGLKYRVEVGAA